MWCGVTWYDMTPCDHDAYTPPSLNFLSAFVVFILFWCMMSYDVIWCHMIRYDVTWYDMRCHAMSCDLIWYGVTWYDMVWCDTTQAEGPHHVRAERLRADGGFLAARDATAAVSGTGRRPEGTYLNTHIYKECVYGSVSSSNDSGRRLFYVCIYI